MGKKGKKGNQPSTKTVQKEKARLVEDKTFGLKNKGKSKKVQQFVKSVEQTVMNPNRKAAREKSAAELRKEQKAAEKARKEELAALFNVTKTAGETKATFSYEAADEEDEEYPDEEYFAPFNPDENPDALEEWIERQRARLTAVTPVTLETFQAWKEQKILEKDMEQKKNRRRAEESYRRSGGGISGRDLFDMDASIFVDDEEGVDVYEFEMEGVDEDLFASEMEGMDLGEGSGIGSSSAPEDNFVSFYPEEYDTATWTLNKTPKQLLAEWCQTSKNAVPKFIREDNTPGAIRVAATMAFCGDTVFRPEKASKNAKEGEHNVALTILRHLERNGDL